MIENVACILKREKCKIYKVKNQFDHLFFSVLVPKRLQGNTTPFLRQLGTKVQKKVQKMIIRCI